MSIIKIGLDFPKQTKGRVTEIFALINNITSIIHYAKFCPSVPCVNLIPSDILSGTDSQIYDTSISISMRRSE